MSSALRIRTTSSSASHRRRVGIEEMAVRFRPTARSV